MSLFEHIHDSLRNGLGKMLEPSIEDGLVFKNYTLVMGNGTDIHDLLTQRLLKSLLPFAQAMKSIADEEFVDMQVVTSSKTGVLGIRFHNLATKQSFSLPKHVWNELIAELGQSISRNIDSAGFRPSS
jgi:hypothetical protein